MRFSASDKRKHAHYGDIFCQQRWRKTPEMLCLRLCIRPIRIALALALSIALLTSCGSKAVTQTNETAHFSITMTLDAAALGQRSIDLRIKNKDGTDAELEQLIVAPVMREMGMASPEMTAHRIAAGQYHVTGEPFSMTGIWELDVRVVSQNQEELTIFKVEVR